MFEIRVADDAPVGPPDVRRRADPLLVQLAMVMGEPTAPSEKSAAVRFFPVPPNTSNEPRPSPVSSMNG